MFKFIKSNKKKIALFLAVASVLGGKIQASVKPLAITTAVLVPVLALGTGLIIWNVSRDKNENDDDKKNNQKPDDKSKNQEGFVPEVIRRLESMNLKNWIPKFNTAIDKTKKYTPNAYDKKSFEDSFNGFYEIINGKKIEEKKIKIELGGGHVCVYAHINESLHYKLVLRETEFILQKWGNSSKSTGLAEASWVDSY